MDISKIQIGLDIATATSVITATLAFIYSNIRENRKNRKAELLEQQKLRNLRVSEYKIEKITEIIYFLNEKIHQIVELSSEIDNRLQLKEDSNKIRISSRTKREISYFLRNDKLNFNEIPDKFKISELLLQIKNIHIKMENFLSYNPFIDLIGDNSSTQKIIDLLNVSKDFYIRVTSIENNPGDFGYFLMQETDKGYLQIGDARKYLEGENKNKSSLPANYEDMIRNACVDDFNNLTEKKKIDIYFKYLKTKLEKLYSIRHEWVCIAEITEEVIRKLSLYSFKLIQNYEEGQ